MSLVRRRLIGLGVSTAVMVLAYVGIHLWDRHDEKSVRDAASAAKVVAVQSADVTRLTLTNANGRFVVTRQGSAWRLLEPLVAAADPNIIDGIVSALAELTRTQTITIDGKAPPAADLGMFGLAPPRVVVTLTTADGDVTLDVGKRNDFNGELYARRRDGDAVVMVGSAVDFQLGKTLFDLREKRLSVFEPSAVVSFEVMRGGSTLYHVVRENNVQVVRVGAFVADADAMQVTGLTSAIANLRATRFVSEAASAAERRASGMDAADVLRVRMTFEGAVTHTLVLAHVGDTWFATLEDESSPLVEVSGEWVARKLDVDGKTLRDLRVMRFERDDVGVITIGRGSESVTLAAGDGGSWSVRAATPDVATAGEADAARVSGVLYTLFGLRAEAVSIEKASDAELAAAGLDRPTLQITLARRDGSELATLLVGKDAENRTTATQRGRGRIDLVGASELEDISAKAADYLPASVQANK